MIKNALQREEIKWLYRKRDRESQKQVEYATGRGPGQLPGGIGKGIGVASVNIVWQQIKGKTS